MPIDPAPTTAAVRSGGRPPSHSHWSSTQGQMRSVTSPARNGDGLSTRGKVSGAPKRRCTFTGLIRQPRRACSLPDTAIGTTGAPLCSATRPTPRCGRPSDPRLTRVPSGKITTASPRSRRASVVLVDSSSDCAALDGIGAEAVEQPPDERVPEDLLLGHEVDRPRHAGAEHERVQEAAVVRREDHPALRDQPVAAPREPEVDDQGGLREEPDRPVDDGVHAPSPGPLVVERERPLAPPSAHPRHALSYPPGRLALRCPNDRASPHHERGRGRRRRRGRLGRPAAA